MKKIVKIELLIEFSNYEGRYINNTELEDKFLHDIEGLADDLEYPEPMRDGCIDRIEVSCIKTEEVS